jgi:hypothetical protein
VSERLLQGRSSIIGREIDQHRTGQGVAGDVGHRGCSGGRLPLGKVGQPPSLALCRRQGGETPGGDPFRVEDEARTVDHRCHTERQRRPLDLGEKGGERTADLAEPEQHDLHALGAND